MKIVRVGFDLPVDTLFDYRCEDAVAADIGARVLAPFGRRNAVGVILEIAESSAVAQARIKPVTRILREAPGCMVVDKHENGGYVTPVECVGEFATFISRIREDGTIENGGNCQSCGTCLLYGGVIDWSDARPAE